MVKVLVLLTAGTNCNEETVRAFTSVGAEVEEKLVGDVESLDEYDILVLPGGFSHGDYIESGSILASELQKLKTHIEKFVQEGKKRQNRQKQKGRVKPLHWQSNK